MMTGIAPSAASTRAMPAPMPLPPPVTRITLSRNPRSTFALLSALFPGEPQRSRNDETAAEPVLPRQMLTQDQRRQHHRDDHAQLIDGRHLRRLAQLQRPKVAHPRRPRRQARQYQEQPRPAGDSTQR